MSRQDPESAPHRVQLLTPDGHRRQHSEFSADLDAGRLRQMYREMVLTRRFDSEATALQRQGELCLWIPSLGQEAAQIGSVHAFERNDMLFPSYREHGVALARGFTPRKALSMVRGVTHGGWDPLDERFGLYTIVLGAQTLHAVGYAMGVQRDSSDEVVGVYFGDGASSQGDVSEAMNWASVFDAPVVFCLQNNQWAISVPTSRQSRVQLYQRAAGFGIPGIQVDGNDILAVYAVTLWAAQRARTGQGPTLIESFTYRVGPHTTSDDPTRYRSAAEVDAWKQRDPISRVRQLLNRENLADDAFFADVETEADDLASETRRTCLSLPQPDTAELFANVYATGDPLLEQAYRDFVEYQASFVGADG